MSISQLSINMCNAYFDKPFAKACLAVVGCNSDNKKREILYKLPLEKKTAYTADLDI